MHDQYKTKVRKLTEELIRLEQEEMDGLQVLNCREQELIARKDMLMWEKNNEKVQVRADDPQQALLHSCMPIMPTGLVLVISCDYCLPLPLYYGFPCFGFVFIMIFRSFHFRFRSTLCVDKFQRFRRSSTLRNEISLST